MLDNKYLHNHCTLLSNIIHIYNNSSYRDGEIDSIVRNFLRYGGSEQNPSATVSHKSEVFPSIRTANVQPIEREASCTKRLHGPPKVVSLDINERIEEAATSHHYGSRQQTHGSSLMERGYRRPASHLHPISS